MSGAGYRMKKPRYVGAYRDFITDAEEDRDRCYVVRLSGADAVAAVETVCSHGERRAGMCPRPECGQALIGAP